MSLRLIVFDVDGTLVDSQAQIVGTMQSAFEAAGLNPPSREAVLSIVGLSLPIAIERLAPSEDAAVRTHVEQNYRDGYSKFRLEGETSPFYPGARELIDSLAAEDTTLLGIATGKSRSGLTHLLASNGLEKIFQTVHCADDHPSKPHPSMLLSNLVDTGLEPRDAVFIGDTRFDMEMGRAAGVQTIGVTWGYHPEHELRAGGASLLVGSVDALAEALASQRRPA